MAAWKEGNRLAKTGPMLTEEEIIADMGFAGITRDTMSGSGSTTRDIKSDGQNTSQPGTGGAGSGRNFLGHRVT